MSKLATYVLIGVEKIKDAVDHGIDKVLDGYETASVWAEHQAEISEAEKELKQKNPQLHEVLPDILTQLADSHLTPADLNAMFAEVRKIKDNPNSWVQ